MVQAWELLKKGLVIEEPQPAGKFLGCTNVLFTKEVNDPFNCLPVVGEGGSENAPTGRKTKVNFVKYDQKDFLQQCVARYIELAGITAPSLVKADTPFIDISTTKAMSEDDHEQHRDVLSVGWQRKSPSSPKRVI
jgi:hypothetical protein